MERSEELSMDNTFLKKLTTAVFDNLNNEQFGAEDLAKEIGLSRSQIHRKLQKINGKSITRFIREIRLEEAHRLLVGEAGTASEISYKVGFSSPTYFNKCFHEYFGYTPGDVKNKIVESTSSGKLSVEDDTAIIPIHGKGVSSGKDRLHKMGNETNRRLAAIMFTDIVGYTALMGSDEDKAFALLRMNRDIQQPLIERYRGLWLKEIGDGILAQFDSAADAVLCAIEIQKRAREELRGQIRIGIHLGDITFENGDVFGDGVNIASRIQAISDPGGIYISESLQKAIRGKSDIQTKYLGVFKLKNVNYDVRIYAVQGDDLPIPSIVKINKRLGKSFVGQMLRSLLLYIVFLTIILAGGWWILNKDRVPALMIFPVENYTGSDTIDYLTSGIHNSLIEEMGKISELIIISPYTSTVYKESGKSFKEIRLETNVDYIMVPTLSCFEDNICLNASLTKIDSEENQIWIEDYSEEKSQAENLIHKITKKIAEKIDIVLTPQEKLLFSESWPVNPDAYDAFFRSHQYWDDFSEEALNKALGHLNIAVAKDPEWAPLYAGLAKVWVGLLQFGYVSPEIAEKKIEENIYEAQKLDPNLPDLHFVMFLDACYDYNWEMAEKEILKSLAINPSDAMSRIYYAHLLIMLQRSDEALAQGQRAVYLDRVNPLILALYGVILYDAGDYQSAIAHCEKALSIDPDHYFTYRVLETTYYLNSDYEKSIELTIQIFAFEDEDKSVIEKTFNEQGYVAAYEQIIKVWEKIVHEGEISPLYLAEACMRAKKYDQALQWIEKGYEMHDPNLSYLTTSNLFDPIQNEPRFIRILKKINLSVD